MSPRYSRLTAALIAASLSAAAFAADTPAAKPAAKPAAAAPTKPSNQAVVANPGLVKTALSEQAAAEDAAKSAQARINTLDDQTRDVVSEYRATLQETESLKRYNQQLALQAAAQHPGTGSRARRWLEHFSAAAEAAARVAIDGIGQISRAAGEGIAALVRPEARGRFALVAMPGGIRTRGGPVPTLGPGVAPGPATGQITVQADGRRIEVRLRGWPTQGVAPLVLLVPTVGDAAPQITPGERSREEGQVVAVFTDVEPGNYLVLVEPSESTSP